MDDKIVYQFSRNDDESIYFRLRDYKDRKYIDLRIFYRPKNGDEMLPTKKGITIPVELLGELKKGIIACEKQMTLSVR